MLSIPTGAIESLSTFVPCTSREALSIPTGAIESVDKRILLTTRPDFQYQQVQLRVSNAGYAHTTQGGLSIPTGAIESYSPHSNCYRRRGLSIPTGAIESMSGAYSSSTGEYFQYQQVQLREALSIGMVQHGFLSIPTGAIERISSVKLLCNRLTFNTNRCN